MTNGQKIREEVLAAGGTRNHVNRLQANCMMLAQATGKPLEGVQKLTISCLRAGLTRPMAIQAMKTYCGVR